MPHSNFSKTIALSLGVLAISLFLIGVILAWVNPASPPPGSNVAVPLNVGSTNQSKAGDLNIGGGLNYWITKSGDSFALKNNAGTVKIIIGQDGNMGVGTLNPGAKLEVAGQIKITGGTPGAGKVLISDANGTTSWQSPLQVISAMCPSGQVMTGINAGNIVCVAL